MNVPSSVGPRNAFVPSPVFVGIVALTAVSGWMAWTGFGNVRVDVFLFVVCGWLLSLCLHEYAHAAVAYACGDRGVAERGYLRLNPLKYTSPLLSIVLPIIAVVLGGIGLPGGAVWIDHSLVRTRARESLISLAGPATNVVFALIIAVPFALGAADDLGFTGGELIGAHANFWIALAALGFLQVTASVLNFMPVPGLDGGNIVRPWLNREYQRAYDLFAPYGFMLLFVLLWQSKVNVWFFSLVGILCDAVGIPDLAGRVGLEWMRFWSEI
ncbi:site-2 protease family protein [Krasilnikovia sp. MM14-A1004]|uniref:site-2 protease family protein n=1 Tax=Krasilnikovia sp. MM14-A1004 TaxID=3373541 RepID=UPI00399C8421